MGVNLQAKVTKAFFNQKKVLAMMDKKTHKVLSRYGAYVRRTAQTSMRTRKGSSPPGQPPFAHKRKLLKKLLFFSYDRHKKIVVIGPVLFERTKRLKVPSTLEHGGTQIVQTDSGVQVKLYPKHPYMRPAQNKHIGSVAQWYRELG
jgi:hypothetical protein